MSSVSVFSAFYGSKPPGFLPGSSSLGELREVNASISLQQSGEKCRVHAGTSSNTRVSVLPRRDRASWLYASWRASHFAQGIIGHALELNPACAKATSQFACPVRVR
jgi:hypothetical protein